MALSISKDYLMTSNKKVRVIPPSVAPQPFPVVLICFVAISCGTFNAAHRFGNWVALRMQYGGERVAKEHLRIVADKKDIIVSNGDKLPSGVSAVDRTIMMVGFIVSGILIGSLIFRFLFPHNSRNLNQIMVDWNSTAAVLLVAMAYALAIFEFFYITFGPLVRSEIIAAGTVMAAIAIAWIAHWLLDH
jgi:hypothetical protein